MKKLATVLSLIVALLLAVAPLASAQDAPSLSGTTWTLVTIDGQSVLDDTEVTLNFDAEGGVSGSAGCNSYGGDYTLDGDSLTFGALFSTMMACEESIMQLESAYLAALQAAVSVSIVNGRLVITYGEGQELVFDPALSLEGAEWILVSIDGAAPVDGTEITLAFDGEGGVAGSAGCNQYSGSYTLDDDTLTSGPFRTTRMACAEAIMQQETAYLTAMEGSATFAIADSRLTLVTGDGVTLVFAPALSLTSGEWTLVSLGGDAVLDDAPITINFGADGTAFGSAGCNSYGAPYTVDGDRLSFGLAVSTLMACAPEIMDQESAFFAALSTATSFRLGDSQLTIVYGEGQALIFEAAS